VGFRSQSYRQTHSLRMLSSRRTRRRATRTPTCGAEQLVVEQQRPTAARDDRADLRAQRSVAGLIMGSLLSTRVHRPPSSAGECIARGTRGGLNRRFARNPT